MEFLFLQAVNLSISAGFLVLVVLLLRLVLKKAPKWMNMALWAVVALRLLFPFSIESPWSLLPSSQTIPTDIALSPNPGIYSGVTALDQAVNPVFSQQFAPNPGDSANPLQILIPIAAVIWLLGVAIMLSYAVLSYLGLRRKLRSATHLRWRIYQSDAIQSPFVFGLIKPKIYVPVDADQDSLPFVIHHEDIHIDRKDHLWKFLGFLLLSIYWFNPFLWVAYIFLCRDMELACDERTVKYQDSAYRAEYSQALLNCSLKRKSIAACPLAFGEVGVKQRIRSVLHYKKPRFILIVLAILVCAGTFVGFMTTPETPAPYESSGEKTLALLNAAQLSDIASITVKYNTATDQANYAQTLTREQIAQVLPLMQALPGEPLEESSGCHVNYSFHVLLRSGDTLCFDYSIDLLEGEYIRLGYDGTYFYPTQTIDWLSILGHPDYRQTALDRVNTLAENPETSSVSMWVRTDPWTDHTDLQWHKYDFIADLQEALSTATYLGQGEAERDLGTIIFQVSDSQDPYQVTLGEYLWINGTAFTLDKEIFAQWYALAETLIP